MKEKFKHGEIIVDPESGIQVGRQCDIHKWPHGVLHECKHYDEETLQQIRLQYQAWMDTPLEKQWVEISGGKKKEEKLKLVLEDLVKWLGDEYLEGYHGENVYEEFLDLIRGALKERKVDVKIEGLENE